MKTIEQYAIRRDFSGLPDFDYTGSAVTAYIYARRLASYLRDPSTIRVRTLEMYGQAPSIEEIREMIPAREVVVEPEPVVVLKQDFKKPPKPVPKVIQIPVIRSTPMNTPKEVVLACATPFRLTYYDIIGDRRHAHVVKARQMAFAILKARGNSYPQIGRHVGDRDHSTVIHGIKRFFEKVIDDPAFEMAWMKLAPCKFKLVRTLEEFEMMM